MTPHRRAGAAGVVLVLALSAGLWAGALSRDVRAQSGDALSWQALAASGSLAGHGLLALPDGSFLALGGEADPGVAAGAPPRLSRGLPGGTWTDLVQSGDLPVSRLSDRGLLGAAALLDPGDGRILLTCDCAEGRFAHLLDIGTGRWQALPAGDGPQGLWYPLLVHDAARDRAILIGGDQSGTGELSTAIWSFDLSPAATGWQRLGDVAWPAPLLFAAHGVAPGGQLYVFSGADALGTVGSSLWRLDLARAGAAEAWTLVDAGEGPAGRQGATLTFDPATGRGYLFGGYRATAEQQEDLADLWLLEGAGGAAPQPRWTQARLLLGGARPAARSGHAAAWDLAEPGLVVHGGARAEAGQVRYLGDAWRLGPALEATPTVAPATVTPSPAPRIYLPWGERP